MPQAQGDALLDLIQRLESVDDVSALTRCLVHAA